MAQTQKASSPFRVGCSGWFYRGWRGRFYPIDLPIHRWFAYYQQFFSVVEMNSPFYRFPKPTTTKAWCRHLRSDFVFTVKVHRSISHHRRYDHWPEFYRALEPLGDRLGCILIQCPPSFRWDPERWQAMLQPLSSDFLHAVEFRHVSWFEHLDMLLDGIPKHVILVSVSAPISTGLPETLITVHRKAYVRFHGKAAWYRYDYSDEELTLWARRLVEARLETAFTFFNNDVGGNAPRNALRLQALLQQIQPTL